MFGTRLKELRNKRNITQNEMAKILNVTTSAISHYENETREPSAHIIVAVAKYFNVSCDYLLGVSNIPNAQKTFNNIKDILELFYQENNTKS